jgi:hypothetical protein
MKEISNMIIIPRDEESVVDAEIFMNNLEADESIQVTGTRYEEEDGLYIKLNVEDREYLILVYPRKIDIPPYMRLGHHFTEEELERIQAVKSGLSVKMDFNENYQVCFHDQIRIVNALIPDMLAVMDVPSEKILSGDWIRLAAKSKVSPAPRYLFTVQAVSGEDGEVWLHTHGLKRCGMYELEMLYSDEEMYNNHYRIIENMAYRMIESERPIEPGDPVYIGRVGDYTLMTTAVDWREAIGFFPEGAMGGEDDRDEYHSEDTYVMMCYLTPDDIDNKKYTPIQAFDDEIKDNPMYYFSTQETDRMSRLARERIDYLKKGFELEDSLATVKIGLVMDKEHWDGDDPMENREHIWFEVKDIIDDCLVAELSQDPYYISGIKKGDVRTYSFDQITDWSVYTKEKCIGPDDAYLL